MNEAVREMNYQERTNIALDQANAYMQRYYLRKKDPESEDGEDIAVISSMRRAIAGLQEEIGKKGLTGLSDKNGTPIKIGDKVRLTCDWGEERIFTVAFKTVKRTVLAHPDFDDQLNKVFITGIVFEWNGYDLFPMTDENGVSDVLRMEVIQ